jgi:hypothetical protein
VLGTMSTCGLLASMIIEARTDSAIFLNYVEQLLYHKLRPVDLVI